MNRCQRRPLIITDLPNQQSPSARGDTIDCVSHNRRARPTIRMLAEDLPSGWDCVQQLRSIQTESWTDLHPLAALDHPIIRKAAGQFGPEPGQDLARDVIRCSGALRLLEVRAEQWRAGVWTDPTSGVRWICTAGLAKGDHQDHDDFYEQLADRIVSDPRGDGLLPTELDLRLLTRETAADLLTSWELTVQDIAGHALRDSGEDRTPIDLPHASRSDPMGSLCVSVTAEDDAEVIIAEITLRKRFRSSSLGWALITRVLTTLSPPVQSWDRYQDTFSTINERGYAARQADRVAEVCSRGELLSTEPGSVSHYVHRPHIADACIDGQAMRALCGAFFVPQQDHEGLPECSECQAAYARLG